VIRLTVQSYNGAPLPQSLSAQFDELGGTVGRADNNQLVLPDPERSISRVHAQVVYRNGGFALIDRGSNPVLINGRPLGNGVEGPIKDGDQLQVGGYLIQVAAAVKAAGASSADSFGDPFADLGGGAFGAAFGGAPAAAPRAPSAAPTSGLGAPATFSLDAFGGPPAGGSKSDPFGGLFGGGASPSASAHAGQASSASSAPSAGGIPDDWDPFAPDPVSSKPQDLAQQLGGNHLGLELGGGAPAPLIPGMGDLGGGKANTSSSIDAMFGLSSSGSDPLANSILAPAAMAPNMANHVDPMRSLNSVNAGSATAAPDNVSALNQPFLEAPMQRAPLAPPAAPAKGAVLSWDEAPGTSERTVIRSSAASRAARAAAIPAATPATTPSPAMPAGPAATLGDAPFDLTLPVGTGGLPPAAQAAAAAPLAPPVAHVPPAVAQPAATVPGAPVDHAALIQALREGLNMPGLPMQALTPDFMRLMGQLLNEAAGGTVDLLVARQTLKKEVQAEVTMISTKGNNPLKFSPSAEVALNYLLNPPARGFMPAQQAMRDAYNDLRAHQVAFVAGVKSALEGVLKRFDPEVLEGKLTQKSVLSTLLPSSRKAKMWDVFMELYGQISTEAQEDFHELFGEEFRRAYNEHIQQLKRNG
jgi:FHA domain-containing protein